MTRDQFDDKLRVVTYDRHTHVSERTNLTRECAILVLPRELSATDIQRLRNWFDFVLAPHVHKTSAMAEESE